MRARDIMTTPVHVIWQNAPVESAAELLTEKSVTALPVVDAKGALVGMVSEGDLLWHRVPTDPTAHLWRHLENSSERRPGTVREVMSARPVTATPDADVADIADLMLRHNVRSVPIVEDRDVVGIVSRRDILRAAVRGDDVLAKEVQHRLDEYADGVRRWTATVDGGVAAISGDFTNDTERTVVTVLTRTVPGISGVKLE
ncbi:MAG TPA: CBS domain-containing protein [Actinoplanes sp.]|nr:CBS domain-containing protein [Actinoplanes sp.]